MNLYQVFRRAFPGATPATCDFQGIRKVVLQRNEIHAYSAGSLLVVVTGKLLEQCVTPAGRMAIVERYTASGVVLSPAGQLRAAVETHALVLAAGWERALPEVVTYMAGLQQQRLTDRTQRLASAMVDSLTERVHEFVARNPDIESPTEISRRVGGSREMCSRILRELGAQA